MPLAVSRCVYLYVCISMYKCVCVSNYVLMHYSEYRWINTMCACLARRLIWIKMPTPSAIFILVNAS
ncbi:hypothetical protein BDF19DRAFT_438538 [Syncephalis fuscata]|nr:hypothetical protein BDF19DRAFT_438538 [Syncephalis fuscata]